MPRRFEDQPTASTGRYAHGPPWGLTWGPPPLAPAVTPGSPEDELNAALEVRSSGGGVPIPWAMLEAGRGPVEARETRVFTETSASDGSNLQRPILQRLFGEGLFDALGVRLDVGTRGPFRVAAD